MPALRNRQHEIVAQELAAGRSAEEASATAGYPAGSSFAANARKRAQREDIKARVMEIRAPAIERSAEGAGLSCEYMLARLRHLSDFNVEDYLSRPDRRGRRFFDIGRVPREVLGRLAELQLDETTQGGGKRRKRVVLRTKLKGHDPVAIFTLAARLQGLIKDKTALTNPDGDGPAEITVSWKPPAPTGDAKAA